MHGLFFRRIRSTESKQWAKVFPASIFDFRGKSNSRRSSFSISSKHVVVLGKAFVLTSKAILQSRFEHLKEREATPRSKGRNWVSIYLVHRICISSMDIHGVYAFKTQINNLNSMVYIISIDPGPNLQKSSWPLETEFFESTAEACPGPCIDIMCLICIIYTLNLSVLNSRLFPYLRIQTWQ